MAYAAIQLTVLFVAGQFASAQKATVHDSPHKKLTRPCDVCHVATSFKDIRFDHKTTQFHLTGAHSDVACLECHNVEDFSKVAPSCATCHQDIHRSRLGVDCSRCHTVHGWTVFDAEAIHENTNFPVQGRHLLIDCLSCHPGMPTADFRRVWTQCYQCHLRDYEAAVSIDHRASGFSTLCQNCHEMTGWKPSIMPDHDMFFPIYSGTHNGQWNTCSDCHVVRGDFAVFECITCHAHNRNDMDSAHREVQRYSYNSQACYECHPDGRGEDD